MPRLRGRQILSRWYVCSLARGTHSCFCPHDPDRRVVFILMYICVTKYVLVFSCVYACVFNVRLCVCVTVLSISCTECEKGKYALESGSTTCRACSDDKTTQRNDMNSCVCKPGYTVRSFVLFLWPHGLTVFLSVQRTLCLLPGLCTHTLNTHTPTHAFTTESSILRVLVCATRVCRCFSIQRVQ